LDKNLIVYQNDKLYNHIFFRDIQKMKIHFFILTLMMNFLALIAEPTLEDQVKSATNPDYYIHVILTGVVKQMIFPGPPHFLSIENGDWAEPRTILKIDKASLLRLIEAQSRVTANHYLGEFIDPEIREDESNVNLVTLDSSFTGEPDNIELYENKVITINAVISAQSTRCHTPFVVEIVEILTHE